VIKSPSGASPAPVGGSITHAMPWDYLYCPHPELTISYGVLAIRKCHIGKGNVPGASELYKGFPMKIASY